MKRIIFLPADSALLPSGCADIKSSFDCDTTTSDTRMIMAKTNQPARDKAAEQTGKPVAGGLPSLVNLSVTPVMGVPSVFCSAVSLPSSTWTASTTPLVSVGMSADVNTNTTTSTLAPRPVAGTPVTTTLSSMAYHPVIPMVIPTPSCQNVYCDNPGSVHPQHSQDQIATVRITSWMDSDNTFHQPGRASLVANSADRILPARVN